VYRKTTRPISRRDSTGIKPWLREMEFSRTMIRMRDDAGDDLNQVESADGVHLDDRLPHTRSDPHSARLPRTVILAAGLAAGIALGWTQPRPLVWPWIAGAATALLLALIVRRRWRTATLCMTAAIAGIGAAWVTLQQHFVTPSDLAAYTGEAPILVRVHGTALSEPVLRTRTSGSMARFDYRKPATYFPMRIDALASATGDEIPMHGQVLVRVDQPVAPFRAGDRIVTVGFVTLPNVPHNPGEFDFRQYARSLGQAGILGVADRQLLHVTPAPRHSLTAALLRWRDTLRARAGAWLLADLPDIENSQRDSLLVNLLLGERDAQIDGWYGSFQRVGLAHVMAISGFHLSVLAAFVLLIARSAGGHRRWHGWLIIAVVLLYLALVEAQMPVLRAGIMTIVGSLGLVTARRLRVSGLVALSAIPLLLWRPDQLFNAGFQLTYGTVLALLLLSPIVRRRWFGESEHAAATTGEMLWESTKTATAVSVTAWVLATPIAIYHFGMIAPLGVLLSMVTVPISAVLLAVGYTKMALTAFLPSIAMLLGVPLSIGANLLLTIVKAMDAMPLASAHVPYPSPWWALAGVLWGCAWSVRRRKWTRSDVGLWCACAILIGWLVWPWVAGATSRPALRVDMIAVGDGSCYLVRSGGRAVIFDAGSSTDLGAGKRSIIPALRRLGVRSVDAIAVTHADLDHYSAVLELAQEFNVSEAMFTPQFLQEARAQPLGPAAFVLDTLAQRRVDVHSAAAGESRQFGESMWTWLHPPPDVLFEKTNDSSMVIRIDAAGRTALLCGDIQQAAMERLEKNHPDLHADIMELPHHGSSIKASHAFVERLAPKVVLQSTGWRRMQSDHWAEQLANVERLVSVRDGACWVEIAKDGTIRTGRFLQHGRVATGEGAED
jgi:competence protein ComEC